MSASRYRTLDESKILRTLEQLRNRIAERFPESGLHKVAEELIAVGQELLASADFLRSPKWSIRILAGLLIGVTLVVLVLARESLQPLPGTDGKLDVQTVEAVISIVVFVGVSVLFLLNLETRTKRKRALGVIHQLRSVAHVIDMHQLTKDPERLLSLEPRTESSPNERMRQAALGRYLDYCSELLSVTSKFAALVVQDFKDETILQEVNEIEALTTGLSGKIWQKIQLSDREPRSG